MTPVTELKGVGEEVSSRLVKLGIESIEDVLLHFPLRYQDRTRVRTIGDLYPGCEALVTGRVHAARVAYGRRRMLTIAISDATGSMRLRFFHFSIAQYKSFTAGQEVCFYGECRQVKGILEMIHPEYRFTTGQPLPLESYYTPVYPTTEGLHQKSLLKITEQALQWLAHDENRLDELLPPDVDDCVGDFSLQEAICLIHRPPAETDMQALTEGRHPARHRLVFEELLANVLSLKRLRSEEHRRKAAALQCRGELFEKLLGQLSFQPTAAQNRVIDEVRRDIGQPRPMMRLVQGDVGSGKTLVAAAALLQAIECGYQAALMAPTEILAEQHNGNFRALLEPLGVTMCLISGRQKAREREALLRYVRQGVTQLVIGTHALFQEAVEFNRLALIVVDEKHRFGVHQRLLLKQKGEAGDCDPHQLIMTATPIPRSLAMVMYADLDHSVIDEMPPGRKPVRTVALSEKRRSEVIEHVGEACRDGAQVYWICTLIEESESLQCRAAEDSFAHLGERLPDVKLGLVHGQLSSAEKESVMRKFKSGEISVLVATTVVEVGVDVPNASLMVIENAERMGLAQLHQLRGRVGRGAQQSTCVLVYSPPLSEKAARRIEVLRQSNDGFEIARDDMRMRGPGEIMGTRQTGQMCFRVANLGQDTELLQKVTQLAGGFLRDNPELSAKLIDRWLGRLARYAEV